MRKKDFSISVLLKGKENLMYHLILLFFTLTGSLGADYLYCPSPVQKYAFECFTDYNTQMLNMKKSSATLLSGVDVEILRAFCSSYNTAMACIRNMKELCPMSLHRKIEATQMNLEGAQSELSALCSDDSIYERYARYMTCFREFGPYSESCFKRKMNSKIRLMQWINEDDIFQLCRDLARTLDCITSTITIECGPEAAQLVPVLVKPMVKKSTKCDMISTTISEETQTTVKRRRPYRQKTSTPIARFVTTPETDRSLHSHVIYANTNDKNSASLLNSGVAVMCLTFVFLQYLKIYLGLSAN
ncbi:uncharacterized protein LOC133203665 [Saccostrea echinata]|uniref:uncharacterized protein LOC133203665 n=1 Tax=Saccostrea echinata TaxID=191078 RepID=UPI002A7EF8FA|nr:uncharacterized protein LOC133203665 [Saccostrea echinata]